MKTRILLVDDDSSWSQDHCAKLKEELEKNEFPDAEAIWVNPHDFSDDAQLLAAIESRAQNERWDAILVDVNLSRGETGVPALLLPFDIVATFRRANRAALALIYSGTMRKHLRDLFAEVGDDGRHPDHGRVEEHIRNIFTDQITGFFSRSDVVAAVVGEMRNAPLLLQIDRLLEVHGVQVVKPEEAEFRGQTFAELGHAVRKQSSKGQRIVSLVVDYGMAAFVDLNE